MFPEVGLFETDKAGAKALAKAIIGPLRVVKIVTGIVLLPIGGVLFDLFVQPLLPAAWRNYVIFGGLILVMSVAYIVTLFAARRRIRHALREQLAQMGCAIEDTPQGPRWRRA